MWYIGQLCWKRMLFRCIGRQLVAGPLGLVSTRFVGVAGGCFDLPGCSCKEQRISSQKSTDNSMSSVALWATFRTLPLGNSSVSCVITPSSFTKRSSLPPTEWWWTLCKHVCLSVRRQAVWRVRSTRCRRGNIHCLTFMSLLRWSDSRAGFFVSP